MTWPEYLAGCCRVDGRLTRLAIYETDFLLMLLLSDPAVPLTDEEMMERLWLDPDKSSNCARGYVQKLVWDLRRRGVAIMNQYGFGYRIPAWARGRPEREKLAA